MNDPTVPQFLLMKTISVLGQIKSARGTTQADIEDIKQALGNCLRQPQQPERKGVNGEAPPPTADDKIKAAEIEARARHDEAEKRIADAAKEGNKASN